MLPPGLVLAFLLPLAPLFLAYAGLWRRFLGEQLFEFLCCHCRLPVDVMHPRCFSAAQIKGFHHILINTFFSVFISSRARPEPSATQVSGSSAIETGRPVAC